MRSSSPPPAAERAKPLLGTLVRVRAQHASAQAAQGAIDAAFAEIAEVHRLMSFHGPASDVSRLNRAAPGEPTQVDARTAEVLAFALDLAERSAGAFDPTIGRRAVASGALPHPAGAADADPQAAWRDIGLDGRTVRLARRLWLDLGGIAKGYAVDRGVQRLIAYGAGAGCVDAGGDLRVFGPDAAMIGLRVAPAGHAPMLEISDGAAASSGGDPGVATTHWAGAAGAAIAPGRFVCVTAPLCIAADALTKVVLALGPGAAGPCLTAHAASAHAFSPAEGWRSWEAAA